MKPIEIEVEGKDGASLVTVKGSLAASDVNFLSAALEDLLAGQAKVVIVDLDGVDIITSEGLGVLIRARKNISDYGGSLILCGLKGNVLDVFKMTRLDKVFTTYDSPASALAASD